MEPLDGFVSTLFNFDMTTKVYIRAPISEMYLSNHRAGVFINIGKCYDS